MSNTNVGDNKKPKVNQKPTTIIEVANIGAIVAQFTNEKGNVIDSVVNTIETKFPEMIAHIQEGEFVEIKAESHDLTPEELTELNKKLAGKSSAKKYGKAIKEANEGFGK